MERYVIDTDPGVDDAHAILMASAHPTAKIEALTVVAGNVGIDHTVANTQKIVDLLESKIPIYIGCEKALVFEAGTAAYVHGKDGLGDIGGPSPAAEIESEHASAALVRMANESPGELTLVALGPLTNLALALHLDPTLPTKFKRLVIMGGAVESRGNTENISSEFNIFTDPEAAFVVFEKWPHFTLVSWEATVNHGIPKELIEEWLQLDTPRARFFKAITQKVRVFLRAILKTDLFFAADGLAMAVALEPDIVQKVERHYVSVETMGKFTRGQTTVDWSDRLGRSPNAEIILAVDKERFYALLRRALD